MIKCRLLLLADHLDKIAFTPAAERKRDFNLRTWIARGGFPRITPRGLPTKCKTAACACGEATFIPRFKQLGLRFRNGMMQYKGFCDWSAIEKFFGIDYHTAIRLFTSASYPDGELTGPSEVASRIREIVATE